MSLYISFLLSKEMKSIVILFYNSFLGSIADKCTDTKENTSGICIYNEDGRTELR